MDEGVEVDHEGRRSSLEGLELSNGLLVSDQLTGSTSCNLSGISVVTSKHESVELVKEHAISSRKLVSGSQLESNLNDVRDMLLSLEMSDEVLGVDLSEDNASILSDGVNTIFLRIGGTDED